MSKLVYQSKYVWTHPMTFIIMILTMAQMILVVGLLCMLANNLILQILIGLIFIYLIFRASKKEKIFKLYDDRIDFVNTLFEEKIFKSIPFSKIVQVRYEDNFTKGMRFVNSAMIYLYLDTKKEDNTNEKVIIHIVQERNREQIIIKILKTFKNNNTEIFVSTKYKKLLSELELKNWTAP
jgi:hypothetical protein